MSQKNNDKSKAKDTEEEPYTRKWFYSEKHIREMLSEYRFLDKEAACEAIMHYKTDKGKEYELKIQWHIEEIAKQLEWFKKCFPPTKGMNTTNRCYIFGSIRYEIEQLFKKE